MTAETCVGSRPAVDGVSRPACLPRVVSVAAVNGDDAVLDFSNVGPQLRFFATGYHEHVAALSGTVMASGTSFASPIVAGLLGSLLAGDGQMSVDEAVAELTKSGVPVIDQRAGSLGTERPRVPAQP